MRMFATGACITSFAICATVKAQAPAPTQTPPPNDPTTGWTTALEPQINVEGQPAPFGIIVPAPTDATTQPPPESTQQVSNAPAELRVVAKLTDNGKRIDRGITWRVFKHDSAARVEPTLVDTKSAPSPVFKLEPGRYVVNAAYGRAYLSKTFDIASGKKLNKTFILNAGGLKLTATVDGKAAPKNTVRYDIFEGEPDQSGERASVIANARPNLIIRLNSGIYRIISHYGDANAAVSADVQVEAGKLTVATVSHSAARVTFKLVERPGGEAIPGIQWSIATPEGEVVLNSVGALPTHFLAPGTYFVTAVAATGTYKAQFAIEAGQLASVEVVMN